LRTELLGKRFCVQLLGAVLGHLSHVFQPKEYNINKNNKYMLRVIKAEINKRNEGLIKVEIPIKKLMRINLYALSEFGCL
jgi:hypothetical protein